MPYTPADITALDTFRVTVRMRQAGQRLLMVLHARPFTILVNGYDDAAQNFADSLASAISLSTFWEDVRAEQSDELAYESVVVQRVALDREVQKIAPLASITGESEEEAMPPNVAMSVTKRTNVPGRHGVGRVQIPGLPETGTSAGLWSGPLVTAIQNGVEAALLTLFVDQNGNEWQWTLFDPESVFDAHPDILTVEAHATVRTMHRRTVGLGE